MHLEAKAFAIGTKGHQKKNVRSGREADVRRGEQEWLLFRSVERVFKAVFRAIVPERAKLKVL